MATVDTQIALAQEYANSVKTQADSAFGQMRLDVANVGSAAIITPGSANLPEVPTIPDVVELPVFQPIDLTIPTEPDAAPDFIPISLIETGVTPTLDATAPTLTLPTLPSQVAEFTVTVPSITTEFDFPEVPAALVDPFIAEPSLVEHATPTAPTIALPSFDAVAPVDNITAPADLSAEMVAAYNDVQPAMVSTLRSHMETWISTYNPQFFTQLARIEDQLETYLAGGTGLSSDVEDAIYERAKDKEIAEARRASRAAYANAAARGFTIPDGAAFSQDARARQAASDNLARSANEIAIKQAEMEQANLQFAVTTSTGLRNSILSAMLSYHGALISINGQALDYAKSLVSAMVQVYQLTIQAYQAKLDAYRAEAQIYDTRVKAAMSYIELYKAEIDALQALTQVDKAKVDLYRSRIDALQSYADIYKTQVQTIVERASLEKMKVDLFKTRVEAYVATVQGKRAEYDGYSAAMSGQEAQVRIYGAQVNAYNAELSGYRAKIDAQAAAIDAQAKTNQASAIQHRALLEAFSAIVEARAKVTTTQLESERQLINANEVQNRTIIARANLANDVYQSQSRIIIEQVKLDIDSLIRSAELRMQQLTAVANLGTSTGKVYGDLAGAALSGLNTLVAQTLAE